MRRLRELSMMLFCAQHIPMTLINAYTLTSMYSFVTIPTSRRRYQCISCKSTNDDEIDHITIEDDSQTRLTATSTTTTPNEFSRVYSIDRINKVKKNDIYGYPITVEANEAECTELAKRFDLSSILHLSADIQLRPSTASISPTPTNNMNYPNIEMNGMGKATVIQKCVRTNDDFQISMEFPIHTIIRPAFVATTSQQEIEPQIQEKKVNKKNSNNNSHRNNNNNNFDHRNNVVDLQRLIQEEQYAMNLGSDSLHSPTSTINDILEDESIYSIKQQNDSNNNRIDIGECIAQLLWSQLDPYPKKPGTDPVQYSITG